MVYFEKVFIGRGAGNWFKPVWYTKYVAWWFEQLIAFGVGAVAYMFLPASFAVLAPLIFGLTFWLPHFIFNRNAFWSKSVLILTLATTLVAALPLAGLWVTAVFSAAALVVWHRSINMRAVGAQIKQQKKTSEPPSTFAGRLRFRALTISRTIFRWGLMALMLTTGTLSGAMSLAYDGARLIGDGISIQHVLKSPHFFKKYSNNKLMSMILRFKVITIFFN